MSVADAAALVKRLVILTCVLGVMWLGVWIAPAFGQEQHPPTRPKVGLVLSGGGAMGMAHVGAIQTLETLGIKDEIDKSGHFNALRPKMFAMDRATQGREIRKMGAGPDYAAGSVHAVTEDGQVMIASNTGSQLGPYAYGAGKVIWVVGAQKLVKTVEEGMRRIEEYCVPREEVHMQQLYNSHTGLNKVLIVNKEIRPGRITMIIIKEELGY